MASIVPNFVVDSSFICALKSECKPHASRWKIANGVILALWDLLHITCIYILDFYVIVITWTMRKDLWWEKRQGIQWDNEEITNVLISYNHLVNCKDSMIRAMHFFNIIYVPHTNLLRLVLYEGWACWRVAAPDLHSLSYLLSLYYILSFPRLFSL